MTMKSTFEVWNFLKQDYNFFIGNSKDLSKISLAALMNALQEQEQKTLMRSERESDTSIVPKVKIGNGEYIVVKGKGTMAIESISGAKFIKDVLFVPNISQKLLGVGHFIQKGFSVVFESNQYVIKDANDNDVFKVQTKGKSFALVPLASFSSYLGVLSRAGWRLSACDWRLHVPRHGQLYAVVGSLPAGRIG
ncbi:hypothetical protein Sango_3061400 [Sesamum angolense]|uniref:Retrovirus-related Pol polyprotein from transposon TNT 1-94-like beta-barrel domain-containing protein n=1 Tax=Sesamum angolense TaxID=2727404 RepID=A0AAE1TAG8_9LAMI|nr:hypothetical protein Sango_3061400 [Sesamum angolense]